MQKSGGPATGVQGRRSCRAWRSVIRACVIGDAFRHAVSCPCRCFRRLSRWRRGPRARRDAGKRRAIGPRDQGNGRGRRHGSSVPWPGCGCAILCPAGCCAARRKTGGRWRRKKYRPPDAGRCRRGCSMSRSRRRESGADVDEQVGRSSSGSWRLSTRRGFLSLLRRWASHIVQNGPYYTISFRLLLTKGPSKTTIVLTRPQSHGPTQVVAVPHRPAQGTQRK